MPPRAHNNPRQIRSKLCGCPKCMEQYPGERRHRRDCIGQWQARYRDPDGRQRAKNFTTKGEADRFLDEVRTAVRSLTYIDPKRAEITLGQWYERWWEAQKGKGRTTTRNRKVSIWRAHLEPKWAAWPLASISYLDVDAWLSNEVKGYHTKRKCLEMLRQLLTAAVRDHRITYNPTQGIELERPPGKHPDDLRPPTRVQCAQIREHLKEYYRPIVVFAEETGMRWGEYTGLRRCHVDLEACTVKVKEVLSEDKGTVFRQPAPKTMAGFRTVPLTPAAVEAVCTMLDRWEPVVTESPIGDGRDLYVEELVFRGPQGGLLTRHNFRRVWIPAIQEAGVARLVVNSDTGRKEWWPRVHDLRHVFATRLKDAGVPEKDVQTIMGHDRGSRVTWLYQHAGPELVDEVRAALVAGTVLRSVV